HAYHAKVRWLVSTLAVLILLLSSSLVYLAASEQEPEPPVVSTAANAQGISAQGVDVLIATQRIESGAECSTDQFTVQTLSTEQLPAGAVLARDRGTVHGMRAQRMILAGNILTYGDLTNEKKLAAFDLPPGFRVATILADARELSGGLITPGARADVIFSYKDQNNEGVATTLVPFVKVISINGSTQPVEQMPLHSAPVPVSLQVIEKDAKRIELARNLGKLSLLLVSNIENPSVRVDGDPVDFTAIFGAKKVAEAKEKEELYRGKLIMSDPQTGQIITYVLPANGDWKRSGNPS
ncbi:MAG TPA: Flp pilus assembly protein CpaB, partial [Oligoflexia bacterium]|nr:Flp pilus assembly protein CpaB [Oligoflexia bacterium]